jgi:hypothetical protein
MKNSINQQAMTNGQASHGRNKTKTMKVKSALSLLTLISFAAPGLVRADCVPSVPAGTIIPFSVVTLRNYSSGGNEYAGYATGSLTPTATFLGPELSNVGSPEMLFSDRTFSLPCSGPGVCFAPQQPFSINSPDPMQLTITDNHAVAGRFPIFTVTVYSPSLGYLSGRGTCDAASGEVYFPTSAGMNVISLGTPIPPAQ